MNRTVLFVFTLAIGCDKHSSSKPATDHAATGQPVSDPGCTAKLVAN